MKANIAKGSNQFGHGIGSHYPAADRKTPWWKRALRIIAWALFVAAITALLAYFGILLGIVAIPTGMSMIGFLISQALLGLLEGLLYGSLIEVIGDKNAKNVIDNYLANNMKKNNEQHSEAKIVEKNISVENEVIKQP